MTADARPAVTVIGTNVVIDYGTAEAAHAALDRMMTEQAPRMAMTEREWRWVGRLLGIPSDWTLRPHLMADGRWKLTATAARTTLPCGHRSMEVTASELPLAVAKMASRVEFHRTER